MKEEGTKSQIRIQSLKPKDQYYKQFVQQYKKVDLQLFEGIENKDKIQEFIQNLQIGDLVLDKNIDYAYGIYGSTKTGKTTTSHALAGGVLAGRFINGTNFVEAVATKYKEAKIGNTGNSQTLIPNVLKITVNEKQVCKMAIIGNQYYVLDTPGYGDSDGVLKILANAYYHYRLYSQAKNMKFILAFEKVQLSGTADKFINTIVQFTSSFKGYIQDKKIRQQIWQSCCFLFTKAGDEKEEIQKENLKQILKNLVLTLNLQFSKQQNQIIRDFITYIVQNDRIVLIKSVQPGQVLECKGLLHSIDNKITKWYHREVIEDGSHKTVDMSPIAFNVGKQIQLSLIKNDNWKKQFIELLKYYQQKTKRLFQIQQGKLGFSLGDIFAAIVADAMGSPDSHHFLTKMKAIIYQEFSKFNQSYNDVRQKKIIQLFGDKQNNQSNNSAKKNALVKNYFLKKHNTLQAVQKLKIECTSTLLQGQISKPSIKIINRLHDCVNSILKQVNMIRYKKKYANQIIHKYAYVLRRLIEQSKIFVLLLQINIDEDVKKSIVDTTKSRGFQIQRPLYDFLTSELNYQQQSIEGYKKIKDAYITKFNQNPEWMQKINLNLEVIDFFNSGNHPGKIYNQMLLKYYEKMIEKNLQKKLTKQDTQEMQIFSDRLIRARFHVQDILNNGELQLQQKKYWIVILRKISNNLAQLFSLQKRFNEALKVLKSIKFVSGACKIYQQKIKLEQNNINLRIQYSQYLAGHFREAKAMQVLQDAFEFAETFEQLQNLKQNIIELRNNVKNLDVVYNAYEKQISSGKYHDHLEKFQSFKKNC